MTHYLLDFIRSHASVWNNIWNNMLENSRLSLVVGILICSLVSKVTLIDLAVLFLLRLKGSTKHRKFLSLQMLYSNCRVIRNECNRKQFSKQGNYQSNIHYTAMQKLIWCDCLQKWNLEVQQLNYNIWPTSLENTFLVSFLGSL